MGLNSINKIIKVIKITKKQSYIFNGVLIIIIKALCVVQFGHTFKVFIIVIIKTPFYLLKINH